MDLLDKTYSHSSFTIRGPMMIEVLWITISIKSVCITTCHFGHKDSWTKLTGIQHPRKTCKCK